jgi:hypothetical protein
MVFRTESELLASAAGRVLSTSQNRQRKAGCALGMSCSDFDWFFPRLETSPIPPLAQKTFDAEGEALEHALTKSLRIRNEVIKSLCSSVRRFRDAAIKPECKSDYPHALQALWKALDRAEDLIKD